MWASPAERTRARAAAVPRAVAADDEEHDVGLPAIDDRAARMKMSKPRPRSNALAQYVTMRVSGTIVRPPKIRPRSAETPVHANVHPVEDLLDLGPVFGGKQRHWSAVGV